MSGRHRATRAAVATTPPGLEVKRPRSRPCAAVEASRSETGRLTADAATGVAARPTPSGTTSRTRCNDSRGRRRRAAISVIETLSRRLPTVGPELAGATPSIGGGPYAKTCKTAFTAGRLRGDVDLGPLKPAGVVDVDRLPLGEDVEGGLARLAMAVPGVLRPAEREMDFGAGRAGVHIRDPCLEVAHRPKRLVHVAREDGGREPVLDPVRDANRLVEVAHLDERRGRAEDLLLRDAHLRVDVGEDRRAVVEALREVAVGRDLAAREEPRALLLAALRVRVDLLDCCLVDHGSDVGPVVPPRPEPHLLGPLDEARLQQIVDALLHNDARRGSAT